MITQQLTGNPNDMSGRLVITAEPGQLPELQGLAAELKLRPNITTNGTIEIATDPEPQDG
jgi:hypothetical protein